MHQLYADLIQGHLKDRTLAMSPLHVRAALGSRRIRDQLLYGSAQLGEGPHRGGVAGSLDEAGNPDYVYAEITGYYLHWLSELPGLIDHTTLKERAEAAIDWASHEFAGKPVTRIHLSKDIDDWRNRTLFVFDFAMLVRGLDAVAERDVAEIPKQLVTDLVRQLRHFHHEGMLHATHQHYNEPLPQRWSTEDGPYLLKASARLLQVADRFHFHSNERTVLATHAAHWISQAERVEPEALHPALYFIEGLLLSSPLKLDLAAAALRKCLALRRHDGSLPEAANQGPVTVFRSDILAQALRLGVLLRQYEAAGAPADCELAQLGELLLARVDAAGHIPFNPAASPQTSNIWCAIFAEQALRWYAAWLTGGAVASVEALV